MKSGFSDSKAGTAIPTHSSLGKHQNSDPDPSMKNAPMSINDGATRSSIGAGGETSLGPRSF